MRFFSILEFVIFFVYLGEEEPHVAVPATVNAGGDSLPLLEMRSLGGDEISILGEQSDLALAGAIIPIGGYSILVRRNHGAEMMVC